MRRKRPGFVPPRRRTASAYSQRVLQLALGHLRATLHVSTLGLLVKLLAGVPISLPGAGSRCTMPSRGLFPGIAATHRAGAFPLPGGADMRFAFALLLRRASRCLLLLGPAKVAAIALGAVVLLGARFPQGNGDRLPSALNLATLAAATALQLAVLEFMHHPAGDALLPG
jgi:hypothetical protein